MSMCQSSRCYGAFVTQYIHHSPNRLAAAHKKKLAVISISGMRWNEDAFYRTNPMQMSEMCRVIFFVCRLYSDGQAEFSQSAPEV